MRILCVDDNHLVRHVTVDLLRNLGHEVVEAEDGESALARLRRAGQGIDLLITDIIMPGGIDGAELAEQARISRPDLSVIYMTGLQEQPAREDEVLTKPCTLGSLAAAIDAAGARRLRVQRDLANANLANSVVGRSGATRPDQIH